MFQISLLEYFPRRLHRQSVSGVPIYPSKIFPRRLHLASMDGAPNISSRIFSQEASPIICDSLFGLIPNIS